MREGPAHCEQYSPWAGGPGLQRERSEQVRQIKPNKECSSMVSAPAPASRFLLWVSALTSLNDELWPISQANYFPQSWFCSRFLSGQQRSKLACVVCLRDVTVAKQKCLILTESISQWRWLQAISINKFYIRPGSGLQTKNKAEWPLEGTYKYRLRREAEEVPPPRQCTRM